MPNLEPIPILEHGWAGPPDDGAEQDQQQQQQQSKDVPQVHGRPLDGAWTVDTSAKYSLCWTEPSCGPFQNYLWLQCI